MASAPALAVPARDDGGVGALAYEFQVVLPIMARRLRRGAEDYGFMTAAMGVGAVVGGLVVAGERARTGRAP